MCVPAVSHLHSLLVLRFHYFLCVRICLPLIYNLSLFTFPLNCLIMVLFHWGSGLHVFICIPSWPCCFSESQSPAVCTLRTRFLSLHHQGVCLGLPEKCELHKDTLLYYLLTELLLLLLLLLGSVGGLKNSCLHGKFNCTS